MKIKRQAISGGEMSGMIKAVIEREREKGAVVERGPKITGIGIDIRIENENGKEIGIQRKMGIGSGIGSTRKAEEVAVAGVGDETEMIAHTDTNMTVLTIVTRKTRVGEKRGEKREEKREEKRGKKRGKIYRMTGKGIKNLPLKTQLR